MTEQRHRYVGDAIAFEWTSSVGPIAGATLEFGAIDPDGVAIAGSAAWLTSPDDDVIRGTIAAGATTKTGKHELQLRVTAPSLVEPARASVVVVLQPSAV